MPHSVHNGAGLPPYCAVLGTDARFFTQVPSSLQPELSARIPEVLRESFRRAGLARAWDAIRLHQDTGDGHVVVLDSAHLPRLVHPLVDKVQEVLEEQDEVLRAVSRDLRLRLRLSLNVGPLPADGRGARADGKGRTMNDAHRLLDSGPVRDALSEADPDVTLVAALFSERVYRDVVEDGHTALAPSRLRRVTATAKTFSEDAWLYVPKPSWSSADGPSPGRSKPSGATPPPPAGGTVIRENSGNIALGNEVGGNLEQRSS